MWMLSLSLSRSTRSLSLYSLFGRIIYIIITSIYRSIMQVVVAPTQHADVNSYELRINDLRLLFVVRWPLAAVSCSQWRKSLRVDC